MLHILTKGIEYPHSRGYNNTPRWRSRKRKYFYIHLIPYVYVSSLPFNYCLIASKHNAIKKDRINVSWKRNCFILILCLLCVFLQIQISWVTKFYYATTTIKDFDYGGKPTWNVCLMIHALKCRILSHLYILLLGIFGWKTILAKMSRIQK